jgi:hypothetical protein
MKMKKKLMKKILLVAMAFSLISLTILPLPIMAASNEDNKIPPPPYEQVLFQQGDWYSERMNLKDNVYLLTGYRGDRVLGEGIADPTLPVGFSISRDSIVNTITIPMAYPALVEDLPSMSITLTNSKGEIIGPLVMVPNFIGEREGAEVVFVDYSYYDSDGVFIEKGNYTLNTSDNSRLIRYAGNGFQSPLLIAGTLYEAWIEYQEELEKYAISQLYDFTGTYNISFDAFKVSTLMGPVNPPENSISLRNYEIAIIDQLDTIQVVGKYKDIPFSIMCPVIERGDNFVSASLEMGMNIPPDSKVSGAGVLVLEKPENNPASLKFEGQGVYERSASSEKGADYNTYTATANGTFSKKSFPLYVATQLNAKMAEAGIVPGPDEPFQYLVGALFPPLTALIATLIQGANQGKKPKKKAGPRDKSWYKAQYPNASDETIAMIMMADALGASGGDEEDAVSVGDNEKPGGSDYVATEGQSEGYDSEGSFGEEYEGSEEDNTFGKPDVPEDIPGQADQPVQQDPQAQQNQQGQAGQTAQPIVPEEPESMVLQTSPNGAQSLFVKDPTTGKWIDAENGAELDTDKYGEWKNQMDSDKKFNDAEFEKNTKGEMTQDKINREKMGEIADKYKKEEYMQKLEKKYGTSDRAELEKIIGSNMEKDLAAVDHYNTIANIAAGGEFIAVVASSGADVGMDILSKADPTGTANLVRNVYVVTKGVVSATAEKGINKASVLEGLFKGTGDMIAKNIKPEGLSGYGGRAISRATGEFLGTTTGGYLRGEDVGNAARKGFIGGIGKATVGAITDKLAGGTPKIPSVADPLRDPINATNMLKSTFINRFAGVKTASGTINHFYVKPAIKNL